MTLKKRTVIVSTISELIILIIGVLNAWLFDGNIKTFDLNVLNYTIILCIILLLSIVIQIYPTIKRLSNKSKL